MQVRLKEVPRQLLLAYQAKANYWMWGKPGIGKTCVVEEFAQKMRERIPNFKLWYFYGPSMSPNDIQAAMLEPGSDTMRIVNNDTLPNWYKTPDAVGAVFLGEAASTDPMTLKQLQKYINGEDMNGTLRKPPGVIVIADSNRLQDKAGAIQQFRALLNRCIHVDVFSDANDNIAYAEQHEWHVTVQAFFKENPDLIDNYDEVFGFEVKDKKKVDSLASEEGKRGVWASMRGWNRISDLEHAAEHIKIEVPGPLVTGSVGTGVGMQYLAHRDTMNMLLSVDQICADPKHAKIPDSPSELYGQCLVLALRSNEEQLPKIYTYAQRLPLDLQSVILRKMLKRKGFNLVGTPTYTKWISDKSLSDLVLAK